MSGGTRRTTTRAAASEPRRAAPPIDEDLEETHEESPAPDADEIEEFVEESGAEAGEEAEEEGEALEAEAAEGEGRSGEEAVLDVLLRRTGVLPEETELEVPEEEAALPEPRHGNEFVCTGCYLIKRRSQLADPAHRLCRDCVESAPAHAA